MFHAGLLSLTAMSYAPHPFCIISRQKSMKALLLISFGMDISTFYAVHLISKGSPLSQGTFIGACSFFTPFKTGVCERFLILMINLSPS
jgi:hypothetical protein